MGKRVQIANTIILGVVVLVLVFLNVISFIGNEKKYFDFLNIIPFLILIISITYLVFLIFSFKKCEIDSKLFSWAFYLNLIWVVLLIVTYLVLFFLTISWLDSIDINEPVPLDVEDKLNRAVLITGVMYVFIAFLYLVSFILFLIGYFKNKKQAVI